MLRHYCLGLALTALLAAAGCNACHKNRSVSSAPPCCPPPPCCEGGQAAPTQAFMAPAGAPGCCNGR